jgi:hypothetical protein
MEANVSDFRAALRTIARPRAALATVAILWCTFLLVLHPWLMTWGATPAERAMVLPGDSAPPETYFTRAISIDASPTVVWAWVNAIGQDRAGFLSNDYLENLFLADIHNRDVLSPVWPPRVLGEKVPMTGALEHGWIGDGTTTTISLLEPERALANAPGRWVLLPQGDGGTRLLLREPLIGVERSGLWWVLWDPMHFVMVQRMLRGVKERAEGQPLVPPVLQGAARLGWIAAGVALGVAFWRRRAWHAWLLLPLGLAAPSLVTTGDLASALAAFLAAGVTLLGALAFGQRWWPSYLLLASAVALVLLLAPDSYAAFGLLFLLGVAIIASAALSHDRSRVGQAARGLSPLRQA